MLYQSKVLHLLYFPFDWASYDLCVIQSHSAGMQIFRKLKCGCWKTKVLHCRQKPLLPIAHVHQLLLLTCNLYSAVSDSHAFPWVVIDCLFNWALCLLIPDKFSRIYNLLFLKEYLGFIKQFLHQVIVEKLICSSPPYIYITPSLTVVTSFSDGVTVSLKLGF